MNRNYRKLILLTTFFTLLSLVMFLIGVERIVELNAKDAIHIEGFSYQVDSQLSDKLADNSNHPYRSSARIFEDGTELGPSHSVHAEIIKKGNGRFSHWLGTLYLSSIDGSDIRSNGKRYQLRYQYYWSKWVPFSLSAILIIIGFFSILKSGWTLESIFSLSMGVIFLLVIYLQPKDEVTQEKNE